MIAQDLGINRNEPHWSEWHVARGLLFSKAARDWFRECDYGPEIFLCPIASHVIAWALLERDRIPKQLADLMEHRNESNYSFAEFALEPLCHYPDGVEATTEGDDIRYQHEVYRYTTALHGVRGEP